MSSSAVFERAGRILQLLAALDQRAINGRLARGIRETLEILLQLADERSAIVASFAHGAIERGVRIFGFLRRGLGRLRGRLRRVSPTGAAGAGELAGGGLAPAKNIAALANRTATEILRSSDARMAWLETRFIFGAARRSAIPGDSLLDRWRRKKNRRA